MYKCLIPLLLICCNSSAFKLGTNSMVNKVVPEFAFAEKVVVSSYESINIKTQLIDLPLPRLPDELESGNIDAVLCRANMPLNQYKNVIQLPISVVSLKLYLIGMSKNPNELSKEQLKKLRFVYVRGHLRAEEYVENEKIRSKTAVSNFDQAITMLKEDRADLSFALNTKDFYLKSPIEQTTKSLISQAQFSDKPVSEQNCYHYINKKHVNLVPKLTDAIKKALQQKTH